MTSPTPPALVETVARAIYEGRNGPGCKPWSIVTKAHKEPYLSDARAAIRATLTAEVSEGVKWCHEMPHIGPDECAALYRAMTAEILREIEGK